MLSKIHFLFALMLMFLYPIGYFESAYAGPTFKDPNLKAELVVEGLSSPTSMAFLNTNSNLVLEKNSGEVLLVLYGVLQEEPVIKLDVDTTTLTCCRGLWDRNYRTERSISLFFRCCKRWPASNK